MVAFISTIVILVLLIAPVFPYAKRRPEGTPLTWGEAMVGATYVFFVFFWAYAVVPHQWLTYADAELGWRSDLVWIGPKGTLLTWFPIDIPAVVARDVIATLIYVVGLGFNIWIWAWWQNRSQRETKPLPVSTYGRPLVKKA